MSNTVNAAGNQRHNQSPWLMTDASHIIFHTAKQRCYVMTVQPQEPEVIDLVEDEDAWDALDDIQGRGQPPMKDHSTSSGRNVDE